MLRTRVWPCLLIVAVIGCYESRSYQVDGLQNIQTLFPDQDPLAGYLQCEVSTADDPAESRVHLEVCSDLVYTAVPASSGDHYGVWAEFLEYEDPVPQGFLVHSMEHGAVVLYHNCPEGCPEVLDAFREIRDAQGQDPQCEGVGEVLNRIIITPRPEMDVPIAATAWERSYTATCLDIESLVEFVSRHYGQGPEDLCSGGFDGSQRTWCP